MIQFYNWWIDNKCYRYVYVFLKEGFKKWKKRIIDFLKASLDNVILIFLKVEIDCTHYYLIKSDLELQKFN